ncbi:ABC transporter ATP-binding protein [Streptococcaceae bacterium ESL0729]|nr:ABC transporter ATP-binding protein [Streptococcaceae bacterium ESL0729]
MTLRLEKVSKKIDGRLILDDISLDIPKAKIIGLVGRNGSGKTTLMRLISSEMTPTSGKIEVPVDDVFYVNPSQNFMKSYCAQEIAKVMQVYLPDFDRELFFRLLEESKLDLKKSVASFSKGQEALIYIACGIASKARYVLLDEPLDGLDLFIKDRVKELLIASIDQGSSTFIIATHNLSELDGLADSIILIKDQKIEIYDPERLENVKVQFVYEGENLPSELLEVAQVIDNRGSVWLIIIPEDRIDEMFSNTSNYKFVEVLQLTTEDVFRVELGQGK